MKAVLVGCLILVAPAITGQTPALPSWFWQPLGPAWAEVFAVDEPEAIERAARILAVRGDGRMVGDFQQLYDDAIDERVWKKSDYYYESDSQKVTSLQAQLKVWDSLGVEILSGTRLYLVGPRVSQPPERGLLLEPSEIAKPAWADRIAGSEDGLRYGVGRFTLRYKPSDAWVEAEEQALFNLVVAKTLRLGQVLLTSKAEDERTSRVRWIKLDYWFSELKVDGRWVDPETGDALVRVSLPDDALKTQF